VRAQPNRAGGALKLISAASIAYGVTEIMGPHGVAQQTLIVVAAMPTAVFTTILATEHGTGLRVVTTSVVASTLLSIATATVTVLIPSTQRAQG